MLIAAIVIYVILALLTGPFWPLDYISGKAGLFRTNYLSFVGWIVYCWSFLLIPMKYLLSLCIVLLLLCMGDLPIGYYTFVRIIITIGAVCIIVNEPVKDLNFWRVAFGLIAIVFNPIIPVYLHDKAIWMPIDIIAAILFTIELSILKSTKHE